MPGPRPVGPTQKPVIGSFWAGIPTDTAHVPAQNLLVPWPPTDPGFVTAIEAGYLAAVRRGADVHEDVLAAAIHGADPTNGGLRYRALDDTTRTELVARLRRFDPGRE